MTQENTYDRTGQQTGLPYTVDGASMSWSQDYDVLGRVHAVNTSAPGVERQTQYRFDAAARVVHTDDGPAARIGDT